MNTIFFREIEKFVHSASSLALGDKTQEQIISGNIVNEIFYILFFFFHIKSLKSGVLHLEYIQFGIDNFKCSIAVCSVLTGICVDKGLFWKGEVVEAGRIIEPLQESCQEKN